MDIPVAPRPDLQPRPQQTLSAEAGSAAKAADLRQAKRSVAPAADALPNELRVRLDSSAGRFVQTVTDNQTEETLRRYPSEAQLAYSRAVMAYMRALHDVTVAAGRTRES